MKDRFKRAPSWTSIRRGSFHSLDGAHHPQPSCKTIFDYTVPYRLKDRFKRAPFMDVDPSRFL